VADPLQIAELRTKIAEAKTALHRLMLGDKEVEVNFGVNRGTKWAQANPDKLRAYINELETELAGMVGGGARPRGPIYPMGDAR